MIASLRLSSSAAALDLLRPGMTVFVPGMSGESLVLLEELTRHPERADGVTFVGVHFPGINRGDYLGLNPSVRQRAYFMSPALREGLLTGRVDLLPLDYPGIIRDLERMRPPDVAVAQGSPPDAQGMCSLGVSQDFLPSIWHRAKSRILHINPRLPRTRGSFAVCASDCDVAFESDSTIPTLQDETPNPASLRLAALVAELIKDGDTLQFGVGRLQAAILGSLKNHRRLRVYSGMVSAPVTGLLDAGTIDGMGAIECGVALGNETFYRRRSRSHVLLSSCRRDSRCRADRSNPELLRHQFGGGSRSIRSGQRRLSERPAGRWCRRPTRIRRGRADVARRPLHYSAGGVRRQRPGQSDHLLRAEPSSDCPPPPCRRYRRHRIRCRPSA
jgi:acyl-CoA hydrolase